MKPNRKPRPRREGLCKIHPNLKGKPLYSTTGAEFAATAHGKSRTNIVHVLLRVRLQLVEPREDGFTTKVTKSTKSTKNANEVCGIPERLGTGKVHLALATAFGLQLRQRLTAGLRVGVAADIRRGLNEISPFDVRVVAVAGSRARGACAPPFPPGGRPHGQCCWATTTGPEYRSATRFNHGRAGSAWPKADQARTYGQRSTIWCQFIATAFRGNGKSAGHRRSRASAGVCTRSAQNGPAPGAAFAHAGARAV